MMDISAWREEELGVAWKLNHDDPALDCWDSLIWGFGLDSLKFLDVKLSSLLLLFDTDADDVVDAVLIEEEDGCL